MAANPAKVEKAPAPLPSNLEVMVFVIGVVATWANRAVASLRFDQTLAEDLALGGLDIRTMAGALRGYVQRVKPDETFTVGDVNKLKKVGPLGGGVIKKMTGAEPNEEALRKLMTDAQAAPLPS